MGLPSGLPQTMRAANILEERKKAASGIADERVSVMRVASHHTTAR